MHIPSSVHFYKSKIFIFFLLCSALFLRPAFAVSPRSQFCPYYSRNQPSHLHLHIEYLEKSLFLYQASPFVDLSPLFEKEIPQWIEFLQFCRSVWYETGIQPGKIHNANINSSASKTWLDLADQLGGTVPSVESLKNEISLLDKALGTDPQEGGLGLLELSSKDRLDFIKTFRRYNSDLGKRTLFSKFVADGVWEFYDQTGNQDFETKLVTEFNQIFEGFHPDHQYLQMLQEAFNRSDLLFSSPLLVELTNNPETMVETVLSQSTRNSLPEVVRPEVVALQSFLKKLESFVRTDLLKLFPVTFKEMLRISPKVKELNEKYLPLEWMYVHYRRPLADRLASKAFSDVLSDAKYFQSYDADWISFSQQLLDFNRGEFEYALWLVDQAERKNGEGYRDAVLDNFYRLMKEQMKKMSPLHRAHSFNPNVEDLYAKYQLEAKVMLEKTMLYAFLAQKKLDSAHYVVFEQTFLGTMSALLNPRLTHEIQIPFPSYMAIGRNFSQESHILQGLIRDFFDKYRPEILREGEMEIRADFPAFKEGILAKMKSRGLWFELDVASFVTPPTPVPPVTPENRLKTLLLADPNDNFCHYLVGGTGARPHPGLKSNKQ